jgi:hypothetical protein
MKKYLLLSILSVFIVTTSFAQTEKRLNLYGSYVFDDSFDSYYDSYNYYYGTIQGSFQYGAGLEFMLKPEYGIELLWHGQNTTAPTYYLSEGYFGLQERYTEFDLNVNYALIGFNRHMMAPNNKVEAYMGLMLGMAFSHVENPDNGNTDNAEKFSWGARLGLNLWASDRVGIKLQTQILSVVQSVGGSLYFGTGGAGAGVSTYSSFLQFGLGGGLTFRLGK